jgi:hypothetical protein
VNRHSLGAAVFVGIAVVLVSLFWATSDYATSRGRADARQLASDITVLPSVAVFSKDDLNINPAGPGAGQRQPVASGGGCPLIHIKRFQSGAYPFAYRGFTLLLHSGGNYFLTPTPIDPGPWRPALDSVFVIPADSNIRVQLTRGADFVHAPLEETAGPHPVFTC